MGHENIPCYHDKGVIKIAKKTQNIGLHIWEETDTEKNVLEHTSDVSGIEATSDVMILDREIGDLKKGKANLVDGKVPSNELPSYVDDVLEFSLYSSLPNPGEQGKIYVVFGDTDAANGQYRWTGTAYSSISNQIDFATKEEAEAGENNVKAMTALRTKEQFDTNVVPVKAEARAYTDAHAGDAVKHLTAAERQGWNAKETPSGAQAKADAVDSKLTTHRNDGAIHVTAAQKSGWDGKAAGNHSHTAADVGAAPSVHSHTKSQITDFPTTMPPSAHSHTAADIGLGNVNNTSDGNKPISNATQTALNGKANTSHGHTAAEVGALPMTGGTITGNLTLKGSSSYGNRINFGDGDYVHISEPTDDTLELKGTRINFIGTVANIAQSGTSDPGSGSSLSTGSVYLVYE